MFENVALKVVVLSPLVPVARNVLVNVADPVIRVPLRTPLKLIVVGLTFAASAKVPVRFASAPDTAPVGAPETVPPEQVVFAGVAVTAIL